jgi:hypothetical protein
MSGIKDTDAEIKFGQQVKQAFNPSLANITVAKPTTSGKLPEQPMDRAVRQFKNRQEEEKGAQPLPEPGKTVNQPGMSQEDLERDAAKWSQKPATTAPETTSAAATSDKPRKSQYNVNQAEVTSEHEKFKQRMARRTERANLLAQTSRAEAEAVEADIALMRAKHPSYGRGGRSRGGYGIFEQRVLQFKPNALKTLLHLQEGGVGDAAAATWNFAKDYASDVWNQGFGAATKKAAGKISDNAIKGIEDATGTEYFTKGAIHPNVASREFVKMTKEVPGDTALNVVKNLARYSPTTLARMQAGRYARAAAFDPSEAEEQLSHYAKIHAMTNPLSYATSYAGDIAKGIGQMSGLLPVAGAAIGGAVGGKVGAGIGKLAGAGAGLATSVSAGLAAQAANKIVAPAIAAQAREAARLDAARLRDWRYAAL